MDYRYRFAHSPSWSKFSSQEKFDHIDHIINIGKKQFKDCKANVYLGSEVAKFIKQHAKTLKYSTAYWSHNFHVDEDLPGNCIVVRSGVVAWVMLY